MYVHDLIVIAIVMGGFYPALRLMQRFFPARKKRKRRTIIGFSIADLHKLYLDGELSLAEFERAKASVIQHTEIDPNPYSGRAVEVLPIQATSASSVQAAPNVDLP